MALDVRDLDQLMARVGRENVLVSQADRLVYSTDVGSPPKLVNLLLLGGNKAEAVVRAHTVEDVQSVVQYCRKRLIPITPRAAATNALGGAIPKRGGVVLDMTGFRSRIDVDEKAMTVTVDAGVVISDLQKRLNDVGLELPCYPTSGLAATIGGFVAMDGHGIHSTRAGNIGKWVRAVEGVGCDGERFQTWDRDQIEFYVGLGGSTGIITTVTLQVVEATPDKPVLALVKDHEGVQTILAEAKRLGVKHAMVRNTDFYALRTEALGQRKDPLGGKHGVLLCFAEPQFNAVQAEVGRLVARAGGTLADDKLAADEWAQRFYPLRAKKLGPSVVAGEVFVPIASYAKYLARVTSRVPVKELSVEGHLTDDGRVYFFIFTPDDERRATYPLGWSTSAWILSSAKRLGGRSYHSGVWLQWESKAVYGAVRYAKLKNFKSRADHRRLMNPGMVFPYPAPVPSFVHKMLVAGPIPAPSLGFQLWAGNPMLQMQGGMVRYRRHKTLGVDAADVAADMARGGDMALFSKDIWGADIPSLQAIPNPADLPMTHTVRGKMALAKAFLEGNVTDPWTLKPALDVADPTPEEAKLCPDYAQVQKVLDAFRRVVAAEGVTLTVKAVEAPKAAAVVTTGGKAHVDVAKGGAKTIDVVAVKKQAAETPEEKKAWVLMADCIVCNGCEAACPTNAAIVTDTARVDRDLCIADGACFDACPTGAIRPGIEDTAKSAGWVKGSRLYGKFGKLEA